MSANLKILSGGAMQGLVVEAAPPFERASGTRIAGEFGLTLALKKAIADGAPFDIALLPRPEIDALAREGKIAAGSATDITRSAIGVAVIAFMTTPGVARIIRAKGMEPG